MHFNFSYFSYFLWILSNNYDMIKTKKRDFRREDFI